MRIRRIYHRRYACGLYRRRSLAGAGKRYLAENVEALRHYLQQNIPAVALVEPRGSFLVWLDLGGLGLDARQLEKFLAESARMATNPWHWFGREGAGFARINIACPRSSLLNALRPLEKAVAELGAKPTDRG